MADDNNKSKSKSKGSDSPGEAIAYVIFAFVIIFVVLLYAANRDAILSVDVSGVYSGLGSRFIEFWRTYINPIFIVLDLLLLGLFIFATIKAWPTRPQLSLFYRRPRVTKKRKASQKKLLQHWKRVQSNIKQGTPEAFRLAVIDADALVDQFLKAAGYEGDHMADRLSQIIPGELESLESVWKAHRLRNNLVHAPHIAVTQREAETALKSYEAFLKEIGAL